MATGKGGGPGTADRNGVRGTFDAPFGKAASELHGVGGGKYDSNYAPFDKPHNSSGGMPEKFFDGMQTANQALQKLVEDNRVTAADALAQSLKPNELAQALRGRT